MRLPTRHQLKHDIAAAPVVLDLVCAAEAEVASEVSSSAGTDDLAEQLAALLDEEAMIASASLPCRREELEPEEEFSFHDFGLG